MDLKHDIYATMHTVTSYIKPPSIYIPITLVVTYILYKLTKKPRSTIPGIPIIPSPKSSDFRTVLHDAAEKVHMTKDMKTCNPLSLHSIPTNPTWPPSKTRL
jgi:hypothetical protein